MWIVFSMLCMVLLTVADIIGKKAVGEDESAPLKLQISVLATLFTVGLLMYAFGLGESGMAPWVIACQHPIILVAICCLAFSDYLYLFCMRFVGMSVMEAIGGLSGIFIFSALFVYNAVTGKLDTVKEMYFPARLILICIIMVFAFLLPNIDNLKTKKTEITPEQKSKRKATVIGVLIALAATLITSGDDLISSIVLGTETVGYVDYMMTGYFLSVVPMSVLIIALLKKRKKQKVTSRSINKYSVLYVVLTLAQMSCGLFASSSDAVRTEIMYLTYPVISIIGARIILKEKYSIKQTACIWIVTLASAAFCIIDYLV